MGTGGGDGGGGAAAARSRGGAPAFVSGCCSGAAAAAALQPLDVLKTRMQGAAAGLGGAGGAGSAGLGARSVLQRVMREGGARGLWRGVHAGVLRVGLGVGVHMTLLEALKRRLRGPDGELGPQAAFLTGGVSRAVATGLLCPVTVVKTRMEFGSLPRDLGPARAIAQVFRTEGARGLYRGLGASILSSAPFSALYYLFYTRLQRRLGEVAPGNSAAVNFASGVLAAAGATVLTQPTDFLRTKAQLSTARAGGGNLLKELGAAAGSAAFSGTSPRFLKRVLQTALVWTLYEHLLNPANRLADKLLEQRSTG